MVKNNNNPYPIPEKNRRPSVGVRNGHRGKKVEVQVVVTIFKESTKIGQDGEECTNIKNA